MHDSLWFNELENKNKEKLFIKTLDSVNELKSRSLLKGLWEIYGSRKNFHFYFTQKNLFYFNANITAD